MRTVVVICSLVALALSSGILQPDYIVADGPPGSPGIFANQPSKAAAADAAAAKAASAADQPVEVTVNSVIKSCFLVAENEGQVGLQAMIQLVWTDPKQKGPKEGKMLKPTDTLNPDIQFLNSVHTELRKEKLVAYPGGVIRNTKRYYLTLQESMNYKWYPFDIHMWSFDMNSFSETTDKLVFKPGYLITDPGFETPVFSFGKNDMQIRTVDAPLFPGQNYSTLRVEIVAKRQQSYALQNFVFPLTVVAGLGYLSFWVSPTGALPARAALCIISILTTLVISGDVAKNLPKISYTTWIDVFINTVLFFVASCCGFMILASRATKKAKNGVNIWDYYLRMIYPCVFGLMLVILLGVGLVASPTESSVLKQASDAKSFVAFR